MSSPNDPNSEEVVQAASDSNQETRARGNLIGMTLGGRYLIEKELGRGGMGAVYLARDKPELHSRRVVVKVLLEEKLKNEWAVKKFRQEIESLTRLDDPGVVGIFDAGTLDDGTPYLVMQYVDGTTLRVAMKPEGMDLQQAATIFKQICRSVAAAHDAGIFHRDLKPENIMLRTTVQGEQQVKIIDFGIAKVKNSVAGPSTATGVSAGTIAYMSPEQLSAQPLTPASDIYALGMIAYEVVTGRRVFNPESVYQLLEMQRAGIRVNPCDLRPALSERAQRTILKSLAFDPADRFQRADEFGDQLAAALASREETERTTRDMQQRSDPKSPLLTVTAAQQGAPEPSKSTPETAHVLFMDIVSYSKLLTDEQPARLRALQDIVRATKEFQNAQAGDQLVRLPTGDGMALGFFGDPEAPVRCASEISLALKAHSDLKLRMGVHSGFVYRIADINENLNISGGGINMAQRVMDCGDAGHILLSQKVADDLAQLSRWAKDLHDLGEAEVKHGVRVHIYNLFNDKIGNPEVPAKLRAPESKSRPIRGWLVAAAALLFIAIAGYAIFVIMKPQRTLNYSLTVQKMSGDQPIGGEIESTGSELYGNGWKFRINLTPAQSGSLYMVDEGPVDFNVLFPTRANNNSVAQLAASQTIQTGWYFFDKNPGTEKVWIVWSAKPLAELDAIFADAAQHELEIRDSQQIKTLRELITSYTPTEPEVDKAKKQSTVRGRNEVLVSLLSLEHNQY